MNKNIKEETTGMSLLTVAELDEENPLALVDWHFLKMALIRLRKLKEIAPTQIAEDDVSLTLEYINRLL